MSIIKKIFFIIIVNFLFSPFVYAYSNAVFFPLNPRIIGEAATSNIDIFGADTMAPIYGNENGFLYLDGLGSYGTNNSWLGSIGLGTRNIITNDWLLGGYLFYDWNQTQYDSIFSVLNPGFEFIHRRWDLYVNGYFPIQEKKFKNFNLASNLGNNNYLSFHQHSEFDNILAIYDVIGTGGNLEIGYTIPSKQNRIRIFAGAYFYTPPNVTNITGVQGGTEFSLNSHMKFVVQDSYDNVWHNSARFSIQFILGGIPQTETYQLQERLLDPIPRHLGTLNTGSGVLNQQQFYNTGRSLMINNNLWFFQPGVNSATQVITQNSCTYEHPCIGLAQTTMDGINTISPNAKLF